MVVNGKIKLFLLVTNKEVTKIAFMMNDNTKHGIKYFMKYTELRSFI